VSQRESPSAAASSDRKTSVTGSNDTIHSAYPISRSWRPYCPSFAPTSSTHCGCRRSKSSERCSARVIYPYLQPVVVEQAAIALRGVPREAGIVVEPPECLPREDEESRSVRACRV